MCGGSHPTQPRRVDTREFAPLFGTVSAQVAAVTVSGLGLGTLVYAVTRSPLLAALSMFGASFGQLIGAATILSATDRTPPRAALTGVAVFLGLTTAVFAVPGLPIAALIPLVLVQGLVNSISSGARYGLLAEIVADDGYLLGRSLLNMSVGTMQIVGFAAGGDGGRSSSQSCRRIDHRCGVDPDVGRSRSFEVNKC